jgi:hypothetical protein
MTYGPLSVEQTRKLWDQGIELHIFVGGKDVTQCCSFVDDTPGHEVAYLFKLNERGHKYIDHQTKEAAMEIVHSDIEIKRIVS